jgi:hypothetical protein
MSNAPSSVFSALVALPAFWRRWDWRARHSSAPGDLDRTLAKLRLHKPKTSTDGTAA